MNKYVKFLIIMATVFSLAIGLNGCEDRQADRVSYNLSQEADNFNIVREITVINCIAGDVIFQMTGRMSIKADRQDNQLEVTVEARKGLYQKHFIGLSDNVTYVVEDKGVTNVSEYQYELNFNPKMWIPVKPVIID